MEAKNTQPSARATDPGTSHAAAASMRDTSKSHRAELLVAYRMHPQGLTDEEACDWTGISGGWKRCSELRAAGLIVDTGKTRPGKSGRLQSVCRYVESVAIPATLFPTAPEAQKTRYW